jgi:hypothetical protein
MLLTMELDVRFEITPANHGILLYIFGFPDISPGGVGI